MKNITPAKPLYLVLCREQRQSRIVTIVGIFTTPQTAANAIASDIKDATGRHINVTLSAETINGWSYDSGGDLTWTVTEIHPDMIVNIAHFSG